MTKAGDRLNALVYNTTGFGPCPATEFAALDVDQIAKDTGSDLAWKNPRRFWTMDTLHIDIVGEPAEFGGVKFNLIAKMEMPASLDTNQDQSASGAVSTRSSRGDPAGPGEQVCEIRRRFSTQRNPLMDGILVELQ